jgi:hypothetical protein
MRHTDILARASADEASSFKYISVSLPLADEEHTPHQVAQHPRGTARARGFAYNIIYLGKLVDFSFYYSCDWFALFMGSTSCHGSSLKFEQ